jgi:hypothetical protein
MVGTLRMANLIPERITGELNQEARDFIDMERYTDIKTFAYAESNPHSPATNQ